MRYSNYCKIIDPNSEYYGQVFEVASIDLQCEQVDILIDGGNMEQTCDFKEIQFCVTKDNEPVKIGEEYVCWDNIENEEDLFESYHGKLWSKAIQMVFASTY